MTTGKRNLVDDVVARNARKLNEIRREAARLRPLQDRVADAITAFSGSMWFVYIHTIWFAVWVAINMNCTPLPAFDPYPFGLLTMIVSLEAIYLSTFVLISQNRMSMEAEDRANLDLHVNLLTEVELTRLTRAVDAIAKKIGVEEICDEELAEVEEDVTPEELLSELHRYST